MYFEETGAYQAKINREMKQQANSGSRSADGFETYQEIGDPEEDEDDG